MVVKNVSTFLYEQEKCYNNVIIRIKVSWESIHIGKLLLNIMENFGTIKLNR
jgi:hypothetical protein